jgi:hypothetical protein
MRSRRSDGFTAGRKYEPVQLLQILPESSRSVSSVERATGVLRGTILKLLVLARERCEQIMVKYVRNVQAPPWRWTLNVGNVTSISSSNCWIYRTADSLRG